MVDLFADIPERTILETLETIKRNLHKVELYGGHTLGKHSDIQLLALKTRLRTEDIRYATSFWDMEVAIAVAQGLMRKYYDSKISYWLKNDYDDCLPLTGRFCKTVGYGFKKGEERLEENLKKARLILMKDAKTDWGFRILTSYPMF